jgi:hypothetical protein
MQPKHSKTTLPTTWALFYYQLKDFPKTNKREFCTLDEAKELAKCVKINETKVEEILKHIHKRFGSVLYYDDILCDDGMTKLVFCSPNVLLKAICEFVITSFGSKSLLPQATKKLRNTGLISYDDFNYLCQVSQHQIPITFILSLLIKRNIISQVKTEQGAQYFIPCLLKAHTQTDPASLPRCPNVAPLLLKDIHNNTKCIPPGFISAMLVKLSQTHGWKLNLLKKERYKNEVTFRYKVGPHVMLIARCDLLEVRIHSCHKDYEYLCKEILSDINKAIKAIKKVDNMLKDYIKSLMFKEGFYCPMFHYAEKLNEKQIYCYECEETFSLFEEHHVWYRKESLSTTEVSPTELLQKKPEIKVLVELLNKISHKWQQLGTALGVGEHIIEGLKANEPNNIVRLTKILSEWINADESVNWDTIIRAVEGKIVENKAVANEIRTYLSKQKK